MFFFIEQTSKQAASSKTYNLTRIIKKQNKKKTQRIQKKKNISNIGDNNNKENMHAVVHDCIMLSNRKYKTFS